MSCPSSLFNRTFNRIFRILGDLRIAGIDGIRSCLGFFGQRQIELFGGEQGVRRRRMPAMPMSFWAKEFVILVKSRKSEEHRRAGKYVEHRSRPRQHQNGEIQALTGFYTPAAFFRRLAMAVPRPSSSGSWARIRVHPTRSSSKNDEYNWRP